MLDSGVVLSGRYRLEERIATGGMGDVWCGTDMVLSRRVAVKVLLPALVSDPDFITRFRAEARMMAALHHPGIVQVYDCGEDDLANGGRADYLVMEYVDGEPLSKRITEQGRLGAAETMSVIAQAAQALHAAHISGIVHRDVKPSNLLVQSNGTVVLVDFGVARSAAVTSITSANQVPGTALYMAPEQAAGRPVTGVTDIYALGAVAYHCLAGQTPFTGNNSLEVAVKQLHDEPPALPDDVPAPVAAVIIRALAKEPNDRYPSAAVFAEAARNAARDLPDSGAPAGTSTTQVAAAGSAPTGNAEPKGLSTLDDNPVLVDETVEPESHRRGIAALIGITVAVLIGTVGLAAMLAFRSPPESSTRDAPAPTATVMPSAGPSASAEDEYENEYENENLPNDDFIVPVESVRPISPTPSPSVSPDPDPEPTTEPSSEPSQAPEETEPADLPSQPPVDEPTDPPATPEN